MRRLRGVYPLATRGAVGVNSDNVKRYKARQKQRGRVRLDLWVAASTVAKLRELHQRGFDRTLGRTLDRILKAQRSKQRNFRESLRSAIDAALSGTE